MSDFVLRSPRIFAGFPGLVAGVTLSGVNLHDAKTPYQHANLGTFGHSRDLPDDDWQAALGNRRDLATRLLGPDAIVSFVRQKHGNIVITAPLQGELIGQVEADGLVTTQTSNLLCLSIADCAAVLLYDPESQIIGACHSGWRGTRANIVARTITAMQELGAQPTRLLAYISPNACAQDYQVGPEFLDYFAPQFIHQDGSDYFFDNSAAIADQLHTGGVAAIESDPMCTIQSPQLHSHRRDGDQAGRFVAFIGLR